MNKNLILAAMLAATTIACGDDAGTGDGDNDGDTNNATNNGTNDGGGDTNNANNVHAGCPSVDDPQAFAAHEDFIFDFEHPGGWNYQELMSNDEYTSATIEADNPGTGGASERVLLDIRAEKVPVEDLDAWKTSQAIAFPETTTIDYGGEMVDVLQAMEGGPLIAVTAALPHGGEYYSVHVIFAQSEDCRDERTSLRDLFLETLAPNEDTTFGQ